MKYNVFTKFIAVALCAAALLMALSSGVGMVVLAVSIRSNGGTVAQAHETWIQEQLTDVAVNIVRAYSSENEKNWSNRLEELIYGDYLNSYYLRKGTVWYTLLDSSGNELESNYSGQGNVTLRSFTVGPTEYAVVGEPVSEAEYENIMESDAMAAENSCEEYALTEEPAKEAVSASAGKRSVSADSWYGLQISSTQYRYFPVNWELTDSYTVRFYLGEDSLDDYAWQLLELLEQHQTLLVVALGVGIALFAVTAVYLCIAAGRKTGCAEVRAGGINRIPLELYGLFSAGVIGIIIACLVEGEVYLLESTPSLVLSIIAYSGYLACLCFVGFCFACAAQFKSPDHYWWHNSVTCRCLQLCIRSVRWLWRNSRRIVLLCMHAVFSAAVWCWHILLACLHWVRSLCARILHKLWSWLQRIIALLPLTWQWAVAGLLMVLVLAIGASSSDFEHLLLAVAACAGLVIYGTVSFGSLLEGVKRMRSGDLEMKVNDRYLIGAFRDFAHELNGLADVAVVAAQKQLKSERMKTELITNVSHDIKTPLTSIINYVDLLQKPHTPEEEAQYLEVLSRQSARMKKLIEDLMEMSKASTGNMQVDLMDMDAVEVTNQALGEFADKLEKAKLTTVYHTPQEDILMRADGRLVWRTMSNVLGNAVKYAMPGTRLYVDVKKVQGKVLISFKNISRDSLNLSAEELMERFVRGDSSRNTEGSGLGLNIARSLMELQKGELELLVDGDLFKVTLIFPAVNA